ncbi:metallophosphoesterase family protein [Vibrio algarum]|uniref:Metallophosphoesterase n=1 Tax=Vibrio algarum TaxID=3020714 RepID=A0ABT4YT09_9VIBR|nr:metallophosphoesterase [Vibrio sp. KJ40-1]MDB1124700.1 metallophosphoesterase [Vibrio sp. KJ40-1]
MEKSLSDVLIEDLESIGLLDDIEGIIITGDITTQGDWQLESIKSIITELQIIYESIKVDKENIFIAPGNHDVVRYHENDEREINEINVELQTTQEHERYVREFIEDLTGRGKTEPLDYLKTLHLKDVNVNICILNSCRVAAESKWTEYGYVGKAGISILDKLKNAKEKRKTYSLMALHHHLLPVTQVDLLNEKGISLTLDAIQLLDKASEVGVCIALHGHQHCSRVTQYKRFQYLSETKAINPISIVSSGSCGVKSSRRTESMKNSYSVITFNEDNIKLTTREINNEGKMHSYLYKEVPLIEQGIPELEVALQ